MNYPVHTLELFPQLPTHLDPKFIHYDPNQIYIVTKQTSVGCKLSIFLHEKLNVLKHEQ